MFVLVVCCLLLVSDATLVPDVNATVGDSVVLQCNVNTNPTEPWNPRFYWQDDKNAVLYTFNEGRAVEEHVTGLYRHRITAFPQDMRTGNISVKLKNVTLEDNSRIFKAFAAVSKSERHKLICERNLHVAVPYRKLSLAVNEETMTAVCNSQKGFPAPLVQWRLHFSNNSYNVIDSRDTNNTVMKDLHDKLYSSTSTIHIPEGPYQSVTCFSYNPTIRMTLNTTYILNKGAAIWSLACWTEGLIVAALLLT